MPIAESELILNTDGSIYHLNLKPEHLAQTIITVGDPDRVNDVTKYFESVEFVIRKREFHTQTGSYKGHRITVISTGIGTDNIDIVLNELDALVNIDLNTREIKQELTSLNIIRIGTSGSVQKEIDVDSFVISEMAIGFDSLLHFYQNETILQKEFSESLIKHMDWNKNRSLPYTVGYDESLGNHMHSERTKKGVTATNVGFYGPQGRILRLAIPDKKMNDKITSFVYNNKRITNLEMETAGIYGMAKLLGHKAVSMNAILANRINGTFSKRPKETVDQLIQYTLSKIASF
ncbi:nucleoside phosphorylase [Aquimarina spongiae]|uniref:Uridine phosphorylase n=1 Tax=Aquimarina spongiae TaxID=570521 RepID=A0A1M6AF27_9FLAO|nr:nucleoside phosphorylase [Aquimarina spongiae]SHI35075.1 uridine phosphorylase [Aquimarina spongiae]